MTEAVRVLVVDDHPVVREGLRAFLASRDGITVVGEAGDGEEAVTRARTTKPDVVLLDLVMPGGGGVAAIRALRAVDPRLKVLVLTSFAGDDQVLPAVRAGAVGYLLKDVEPAELERAVRAAARGESLLNPQVAALVLDAVAGSAPDPATALTPREREVLALLAEGLTNRLIARRLVVADKTVKTHMSAILAKLGVADRTQAALWAVRHGIGGTGGADAPAARFARRGPGRGA